MPSLKKDNKWSLQAEEMHGSFKEIDQTFQIGFGPKNNNNQD